jgi:hypothetical protein
MDERVGFLVAAASEAGMFTFIDHVIFHVTNQLFVRKAK